jgi:hypothetical protein
MKAGLMAMVLASVAAFGQAASAPSPASAPMRVYTNPELHLTFLYPAELTTRDTATALGAERRMVYGTNAATEGDHSRPDTCAKVLLAVGEDSAGNGTTGTRASIALFDVNAQCYPPKVLRDKKAMDLLLRNFTIQATTEMGMMPIEQPMFYDLEGHRMHFCAAQGTPVTTGDLQTGEEQVVGAAAVAVEGHVLGWVLEANDPVLFNRLMGSQVDLGGGTAQRLFPTRVQ